MVVYKRGSVGEQVKQIQKALGIKADGIFGKGTEDAVKKFQQENGLPVDGFWNSRNSFALATATAVLSFKKDF